MPLRGAAAVPRAVALVTAARVARVGDLADQLVALCSSVDMRLDILCRYRNISTPLGDNGPV